MPFYRRVIEEKARQSSDVAVFMVSFDPQGDLDRYLSEHRLVPDLALSLHPDQFKLRRTPTIMLVDSAGLVIDVWRGRLAEEEQA
jgi:hypothetical protein